MYTNWPAEQQTKFMELVSFQELIISPANYGARRFISMITMARQWYVSWARWIHSTTSHPIFKVHFKIMLSL
jgi:hypothetical protein